LQLLQLVLEHPEQEEPPELLKFSPLLKLNPDISFSTFRSWHLGQTISSEDERMSFSKV